MPDRPYQTKLFTDVRRAIVQGKKRILVVLPTGGGKGYLAARMLEMAATKGSDSIFFAAQRELIFQLGNQLAKLDVPSETIMAGVKNEYQDGRDFMKASMVRLIAKDTLWSRAFKNSKIEIPPAKIVHYDEAHGSLAKTTQVMLEHFRESIVIGWTATPCRSDNKPLGSFYDCMVKGPTYKELQDDGFLVPVKVIAPDRPDLKGISAARGDYAKAALEKRMNRDEMVGSIVGEWKKHNKDRSTVCFAAGVAHSIHIRDEFRAAGITAEHVDGKTEDAEREDIMGRVADGATMVLCNYGVATTGVDIPRLKYMICARPTKSFSLHRQMGGRIQRPFEDHDHCMIQDHSDNCLIFGYPDEDVEWVIDGDVDIAKEHAERKKKEKESTDPFRCEKCQAVYRGPHCPSCGHKPEKKGEKIDMTKEQLKELDRKKANKEATTMDKQKFWDQCLGWAVGKRVKVGAAAHRYKERFGVWPASNIQNVPRQSQWQMNATAFYMDVVKPAKELAAREAAEAAQEEFAF
jgi:superfamily II DNA or RNA helicase